MRISGDDRGRDMGRSLRELQAVLAKYAQPERRKLLEMALELFCGGEAQEDPPSAGGPAISADRSDDDEVIVPGSPTAMVRSVLRGAKGWMTTTEILAAVHRLDPTVGRRQIYATINKLANKSRSIARAGASP